jgi:copper transport protein
VPNLVSVRIARNGRPVSGAEVVTQFTMLDMEMGSQSYVLKETAPGVYSRSAPALVMVGHWGLNFEITPPGKAPFSVLLVDRASG